MTGMIVNCSSVSYPLKLNLQNIQRKLFSSTSTGRLLCQSMRSLINLIFLKHSKVSLSPSIVTEWVSKYIESNQLSKDLEIPCAMSTSEE